MIKFYIDLEPVCAHGTQICYNYKNTWDCELNFESSFYFPLWWREIEYIKMIEDRKYYKHIYLFINIFKNMNNIK